MLILGRGKHSSNFLFAYFCLIKEKLIYGNSNFKDHVQLSTAQTKAELETLLKVRMLITFYLRVHRIVSAYIKVSIITSPSSVLSFRHPPTCPDPFRQENKRRLYFSKTF